MKQQGGVKKVNSSVRVVSRRKLVITRLEEQLKKGIKVTRIPAVDNSNKIAVVTVELTEKDIKRIEKEIETLKSRI